MLRRLRFVVPVALGALVLLPAGSGADNPVLTGDVGAGDAFTISLVDAGGAGVTHLDPGTYTLVVHDHSDLHDFHLFGPGGVNVSTDVGAIGDFTFTVTLVDGVYRFVCDPHNTIMHGTFTVGTPPPPPPVPAPARLAASVGPGARIGITGTAGVSAGKAIITVRDASKIDNFHLVGPGVNRATGIGFRGKVTWAVTLKAGRYTFRSDRHKALRGSLLVAAAG